MATTERDGSIRPCPRRRGRRPCGLSRVRPTRGRPRGGRGPANALPSRLDLRPDRDATAAPQTWLPPGFPPQMPTDTATRTSTTECSFGAAVTDEQSEAEPVPNGGYRVGCHIESATLCNQHQARMSKQADVGVHEAGPVKAGAGARRSPDPAHQGLGGHEVPHRGGTCGDARTGRGGDGGAEPVGDDRITLVPGAVEGSKRRCPQT